MKNSISCFLTSLKNIEITINSKDMVHKDLSFLLYINDEPNKKLVVTNIKLLKDSNVFTLQLNEEYDFANQYSVLIEEIGFVKVNTTHAVDFEEFDDLFFYDGNDLGSNVKKGITSFALWAPLAGQVKLKIENDNAFEIYEMKRSDKGVYRISLPINLEGKRYHYIVNNNEIIRETNDPYGKEVSLNSEYSIVTSLEKLTLCEQVSFKNSTKNLLDCIIYETNVRDFSENKNSNISNKGKYLGFVESDRKTNNGNKAGLDYLKYLDITHVQLNPITDYFGVDDLNSSKKYNWGYDVLSFFALEGSYSTQPDVPYSRINEFRYMVNSLHKNNIGVILDVVFNHVYKWQDSCFEKTVPGYFFRKKSNGALFNASGCGNDFATERKMARKFILDSLLYFIKAFDVDGFRFDLMGLIDIETLNTCISECHKYKENIVFYGEGWKMFTGIHTDKLANYENAKKLPNVGFFNDTFRDIVKGPTFGEKNETKGYASGDPSYHFGLDYVFHACILKHTYDPKYIYAHQSINFVECHDNQTLFDKMSISNATSGENSLISKVNLANAITILSIGVPFIHSGQEIGQSKNGLDNTYNVTKVNQFDWNLVDDRQDMINYFKSLIHFKKNVLPYSKLDKAENIQDCFVFFQHENNVLTIRSKIKDKDNKEYMFLVNPTDSPLNFELDDYYFLYGHDKNHIEGFKSVLISPNSLLILYKI